MNKHLTRNKKILFVVILFITSLMLQMVQIKNRNMYLGKDWVFHYNRFYDAAEQIRQGNFQYFISMYGFSQTGRIVNALYGPMFAYLNGLLLLVSKSWINYQLLSNFLITFLSALSMFLLLYKNKVRPSIGLILSVLYSTLYMVQSWSFNQALGSWGGVLIPLGVLAATDFLRDDYTVNNMLFLIFIMSISIQTHLLTTLFLIVILSLFFIVSLFKKTNKKQLLTRVIIAAMVTFLMTANVWYPLLEVNMENQTLRPFVEWNMEGSAIRLRLDSPLASMPLVVFLLFAVQFICIIFSKQSLLNELATFMGCAFFVLSLKIIPWNNLAKEWPSLTIIQFPSRILLPATILIILSLGLTIEYFVETKHDHPVYVGAIYLLIGSFAYMGISNHYEASLECLRYWYSEDVQSTTNKTVYTTKDAKVLRGSFGKGRKLKEPLSLILKTTPDYVPVKDRNVIFDKDFHSYDKYDETVYKNKLNDYLQKNIINNKLELTWDSDEEFVELPVFVYKRTELSLNGKVLTSNEVTLNDIGAPTIHSKSGKNIVTISYRQSVLCYISFFVSLFSGGLFVTVCIVVKKRHREIR